MNRGRDGREGETEHREAEQDRLERMACYGVFTGGARENLHTEHLSPAP